MFIRTPRFCGSSKSWDTTSDHRYVERKIAKAAMKRNPWEGSKERLPWRDLDMASACRSHHGVQLNSSKVSTCFNADEDHDKLNQHQTWLNHWTTLNLDVHPRHCRCNNHEDRPVRLVGYTGYTPMTGSHLRCLKNLGHCSNLWVVWGSANKKPLGPFWRFIKWQWSTIQIAKVQQQKNQTHFACFCIRADCLSCLSWVQSYNKPLDSERNAAALSAKDSSPPWHKSYTQSANVSGWVVSWRCFEQMALASSSWASLQPCDCAKFIPVWFFFFKYAAPAGLPPKVAHDPVASKRHNIHFMVWNIMEWYGNRVRVQPASMRTHTCIRNRTYTVCSCILKCIK